MLELCDIKAITNIKMRYVSVGVGVLSVGEKGNR